MSRKTLGRWRLAKRIGGGGNGDVWRALDRDGTAAAVKILRRTDRERFARFKSEVAFLKSEPANLGILPLLDSDLDDLASPWYAMPIAIPIAEWLGSDPLPEVVVDAMATIAETLAELAARRIGHRDIKPANLFRLDDRCVVGDFGLVAYPDAEPLTKAGKRLGPIDFMAPEMRENADVADAAPADVYSLAKTAWVLLTGSAVPLPGPHRADDPAYSLTSLLRHPWTPYLDSVLRRATFIEPSTRIEMSEFARELRALSSTPMSDVIDNQQLAARLRRLAEPGRARAAQFEEIELGLNRASSAAHEVLNEAFDELRGLLDNWDHARESGNVPAYELMELPTHGIHGQRGRVDVLSTASPADPSQRVSISVTVGVRLHTDQETLVIAGGVRFESGQWAVLPEWTSMLTRSMPLGSPLELATCAELSAVLRGGVALAMERALEALETVGPA